MPTILLLLVLFACESGKHDSVPDSGGDDGGGNDGGTTTRHYFDCAWGGGGLDITLSGGDASGYWIGLAETDCGGACWTGEDCVYGYIAGDGTSYSYCHPASPSGIFLETVDSLSAIVEGSTTLHSAELHNTYFMEEVATGSCWIWGYDTSYYAGLGCHDIGPGCSGE